MFVRRTLPCGLLLAWATISVCSTVVGPPKRLEQPQNCTVFTHMVKSGGTTIKDHLIEASIQYAAPMPGASCSAAGLRLGGQEESCVRDLHNSSVITSAYGELLRLPLKEIGRQCDYFTMVRHPIDRLVSAFFYCPTDHDLDRKASKWCSGNHDKDTAQPLLMEYATTHWKNKAMNRLILSTLCPRRFIGICSEKQEALTRYKAVVGIFEHFALSMELFNAVVVSPVRNWTASKHSNPGTQSNLRQELLMWARLNTEPRRFLAPDLMIYDQAVSIFRRQTRAELGTEW